MSKRLIYAEDAIDAIENVDWYHQNKNKDMVHGANSSEDQAWYKADDIYETLEALPSAQPTDTDIQKMQDIEQAMLEKAYECGKRDAAQWIPCSERLPKPYEYCLWTTTDGRVVYHHCDGLFSNYTAWMPLPEPWKGEEHG